MPKTAVLPCGIMTKVSGEALGGPEKKGICEDAVKALADEIIEFIDATGVTPALLPGGGNFVRGRDAIAASSIERAEADYEGMIGTARNAVALTEALNQLGHRAVCQITLSGSEREPDQRHYDHFDRHAARDLLRLGRVVVLGGGTGRPYCSTDLACVMLGGDLGVESIMKGTNAPGVWNGNPNVTPESQLRLFRTLSFESALEGGYEVLEASAWATSLSGVKLPVTVYDMRQHGNLIAAYRGEIGTIVSIDGKTSYWT